MNNSDTIGITRRTLLGGTLPLIGGSVFVRPAQAEDNEIAKIEQESGGRLGVFALNTGSGRTLAHRADERFTMCSAFKGLLAACILARVDAGQERSDRAIHFSRSDLLFTSPITKANVERGSMQVGELCKAILEVSDNTAAVLLLSVRPVSLRVVRIG